MLLRENGRRTQHHDLLVVLGCLEGSAQGDLGLAEAYIAADEAVHRFARLHIRFDVGNRCKLIIRFLVGEGVFHLVLPRSVGAESEALDCGAACIDVNQVEGELFRSLARLRHGTRPIRRVQARQARVAAFGADVACDAVELFDRHVELVAFRILEQQVVATRAVDVLLHEPGEVRDTMRSVPG